jgi:hypothetical protein
MATDELYKELVAGALEDNRLTARISFLLGEIAIHSSDYAVVARAAAIWSRAGGRLRRAECRSEEGEGLSGAMGQSL